MSAARRVEIHANNRLFDDFFKVDELMVRHERYDGTMSGDERRLVFARRCGCRAVVRWRCSFGGGG
ncbi:MAG: hypothetical protein ACTHJS_02190, partial [Xanthobacteraceae bacterium]